MNLPPLQYFSLVYITSPTSEELRTAIEAWTMKLKHINSFVIKTYDSSISSDDRV